LRRGRERLKACSVPDDQVERFLDEEEERNLTRCHVHGREMERGWKV